MPAELMFEMFESRLFERLAGARSDSLRDSFAISSVFNGLRIGKFRGPASSDPPISHDAEDGLGVATPFGSAIRSPPLHRLFRNVRGFGGFPTRFRLISMVCREENFPSLPAGRRWDRCVAPAKPGLQGTARGRAASDRERAARSRRLGDLRQPPSRVRRLGSPAAARHAAVGFLREHGHGGFSSSEGERRE
jgi:hypothetical protein